MWTEGEGSEAGQKDWGHNIRLLPWLSVLLDVTDVAAVEISFSFSSATSFKPQNPQWADDFSGASNCLILKEQENFGGFGIA